MLTGPLAALALYAAACVSHPATCAEYEAYRATHPVEAAQFDAAVRTVQRSR